MAISKLDRFVGKLQFGYKARMDFYAQVAALLRAGMNKTDALHMAWQVASKEGKKPKEGIALILTDVLDKMKNGDTFGQALKGWVPVDDIMILEAIENSPDFAGNLVEYIELSGKKKKIMGTIKGGIAYPAALLGAVYGMMLYFGNSVIPQIDQILPKEKWEGIAKFLAFMSDFANFYAGKTALAVAIIVTIIVVSLPRWSSHGRRIADKFPIYSTYRMYTGISFLMSIAALMKGGTSTTMAIDMIRPNTKPYVRKRLDAVRKLMLNGNNLGAALHRAKTGWPDPKMNLSIKVFAETQDLSEQLSVLARDWIDESQKSIEASMGIIRTLCMLVVFVMILGIVGGIYGVQGQLSSAMQGGG